MSHRSELASQKQTSVEGQSAHKLGGLFVRPASTQLSDAVGNKILVLARNGKRVKIKIRMRRNALFFFHMYMYKDTYVTMLNNALHMCIYMRLYFCMHMHVYVYVYHCLCGTFVVLRIVVGA